MLFNVFSPPMSNFLNPFHLIRWVKKRGIIKAGKNCHLTQKEANFWFEGPPFDIAQRYANHVKTLMISLFFMPMLPLSLVAGALSMVTAHITEKYLIYRRHTAPQATGPKLCFAMFRFFDIVMLVYAVSFIVCLTFRWVKCASIMCSDWKLVDTVGSSSDLPCSTGFSDSIISTRRFSSSKIMKLKPTKLHTMITEILSTQSMIDATQLPRPMHLRSIFYSSRVRILFDNIFLIFRPQSKHCREAWKYFPAFRTSN